MTGWISLGACLVGEGSSPATRSRRNARHRGATDTKARQSAGALEGEYRVLGGEAARVVCAVGAF